MVLGIPYFKKPRSVFQLGCVQKIGSRKNHQATDNICGNLQFSTYAQLKHRPPKWLAFLYTARSLILARKHRFPSSRTVSISVGFAATKLLVALTDHLGVSSSCSNY
jgi:hypothetical protein